MAFFGSDASSYASKGLELFFSSVFPALFPFMVCTNLLAHYLGGINEKKRRSALRFPMIFLICAISGSPSGSVVLKKTDSCKKSALCALFNLSSPVFILSVVCANMLDNLSCTLSYAVLISHYASAFVLALPIYLSIQGQLESENSPERCTTGNFFDIFLDAVSNAMNSMLRILAMIVFFFVLSGLTDKFGVFSLMHPALGACACGMFEITGGLSKLSAIQIALDLKLELAVFMLSFGGLSIFMQANALKRVDALSYLCAKLLHAFVSVIFIKLMFPLVYKESAAVFVSNSETLLKSGIVTAAHIAIISAISSVFASLAAVFVSGKVRE